MAVLQSQTLAAGPIEALFTVDEETTMSGAEGLKPGVLQGELYINLDAEEEGALSSAAPAARQPASQPHTPKSLRRPAWPHALASRG